MAVPFMEHPSGDFQTAIEAMADAVKRLRALPEWGNWITFCAQGMGHRLDSYHLAEIRIRRDELQLSRAIDARAIIRLANVPSSSLSPLGSNYSVAKASPEETALILDAIFRHCLGIRPHTGEGNDYAIGAEW